MSAEANDAALSTRKRRAQYRASYRGTKEMDWLLGKFATDRLDGMSDTDLTAFEQFLSLADPDIQTWLMDTQSQLPVASPDPQFHALINDIRAFHGMSELEITKRA